MHNNLEQFQGYIKSGSTSLLLGEKYFRYFTLDGSMVLNNFKLKWDQ